MLLISAIKLMLLIAAILLFETARFFTKSIFYLQTLFQQLREACFFALVSISEKLIEAQVILFSSTIHEHI